MPNVLEMIRGEREQISRARENYAKLLADETSEDVAELRTSARLLGKTVEAIEADLKVIDKAKRLSAIIHEARGILIDVEEAQGAVAKSHGKMIEKMFALREEHRKLVSRASALSIRREEARAAADALARLRREHPELLDSMVDLPTGENL